MQQKFPTRSSPGHCGYMAWTLTIWLSGHCESMYNLILVTQSWWQKCSFAAHPQGYYVSTLCHLLFDGWGQLWAVMWKLSTHSMLEVTEQRGGEQEMSVLHGWLLWQLPLSSGCGHLLGPRPPILWLAAVMSWSSALSSGDFIWVTNRVRRRLPLLPTSEQHPLQRGTWCLTFKYSIDKARGTSL